MTELLLSGAYTVFFLFLIPRLSVFRSATVRPIVFQSLFVVKLLASIGLYVIYTWYYTDRSYADIFRYFDDSAIISNAFYTRPLHYFRMISGVGATMPELSVYYDQMRNWYNTDLIFNDSRTMIRICAVLRIFSCGTYFPIAIIFSFLSMLGLTGLFRSFDLVLPGRELPLLAGVFLLPSTLLWTSGIIKEALLMFAAGLFLYQFVLAHHQKTIGLKRVMAILLLSACLFLIKSYFMFLMLPGIISFLLWKKSSGQAGYTVALHLVYYTLIIFLLPQMITGRQLPALLSEKQFEFEQVAKVESAKSYIEIPKLDDSYQSLLMNAPGALLRTFARPFIFESRNPLMLLAGIENLVLNIFLALSLFSITSTLAVRWKGLHWSALFLVISLSMLVGLITPILGAIVRYKVPVLPFLVFVMVTLPSGKWISRNPVWLLK